MKPYDRPKTVDLHQFLPYPTWALFPSDVTAPVVEPAEILDNLLPCLIGHCEGLAWVCYWSLLGHEGPDHPDKVKEALAMLAEQLALAMRLFKLCPIHINGKLVTGSPGGAAARDEERCEP